MSTSITGNILEKVHVRAMSYMGIYQLAYTMCMNEHHDLEMKALQCKVKIHGSEMMQNEQDGICITLLTKIYGILNLQSFYQAMYIKVSLNDTITCAALMHHNFI